MSDLYGSIREIVLHEIQRQSFSQLAVVTEHHPHADESDTDNYSCTVELRNRGIVLKQVPVLTHRKGFAAIPDVGDLVVVQFLDGDINAPIIIGSVYNDEDRPPVNTSGQVVYQLPLGGDIDFAVSSEETASITLKLGSSVELEIIDDDPAITIKIGGSNTVEISNDGSITLNSGNTLDLKSSGNMSVEAGGTLTLKGAKVDINP